MARGLRIVGLALAVTGCAVERPPVPISLPPPAASILVPPPIISKFGDWDGAGGAPRLWQHSGIDIRVSVGTPVLAAAPGTILRVGRQPLAGRLIAISHGGEIATVYFHLSEIGVRAGQIVRRGDVIGRTGMTGNATTPHLHFGVCRHPDAQCGSRIDAGWKDPTAYWIKGNPCFVAGRALPAERVRLTYPVPCAG